MKFIVDILCFYPFWNKKVNLEHTYVHRFKIQHLLDLLVFILLTSTVFCNWIFLLKTVWEKNNKIMDISSHEK